MRPVVGLGCLEALGHWGSGTCVEHGGGDLRGLQLDRSCLENAGEEVRGARIHRVPRVLDSTQGDRCWKVVRAVAPQRANFLDKF